MSVIVPTWKHTRILNLCIHWYIGVTRVIVEEVPASCDVTLLSALTELLHGVIGAGTHTVRLGHFWSSEVEVHEVDVGTGGSICPPKVCCKYIDDQTLITSKGPSVFLTDFYVRFWIVSCGGISRYMLDVLWDSLGKCGSRLYDWERCFCSL